MTVSLISVGVLSFLIFGLGALISILRVTKNAYYYGAPADPTKFMTKLVRAHGNTTEFAPILCILILYLSTTQPAPWVINSMILVTISRVLVVIGFLTCKTLEKIHPVKAIGAGGTYVFGLVLVVALLMGLIL